MRTQKACSCSMMMMTVDICLSKSNSLFILSCSLSFTFSLSLCLIYYLAFGTRHTYLLLSSCGEVAVSILLASCCFRFFPVDDEFVGVGCVVGLTSPNTESEFIINVSVKLEVVNFCVEFSLADEEAFETIFDIDASLNENKNKKRNIQRKQYDNEKIALHQLWLEWQNDNRNETKKKQKRNE